VRLRAAGWRVCRLDAEMAWHDAAMTRFGQWWRRTLRSGYAFAQGAALHGAPPSGTGCARRAAHWPGRGAAAGDAAPDRGGRRVGALLLLLYPAQVARLALRSRRWVAIPWRRALFLVLGKLPEALGVLRFGRTA
jgi:hypothetical protein